MSNILKKPLASMDEVERRYFEMEVNSMVQSFIRQHGNKGGQALLAAGVALRDHGGKQLYGRSQSEDEAREAERDRKLDSYRNDKQDKGGIF